MTPETTALHTADTTAAPVIEVRNLSKSFGHVEALKDVSLTVPRGQVSALLGDNGAGKSTLIKILSGLYVPDGGQILLQGRPVAFRSPSDAVEAGIATVYQDLALVDTRDVAANIFLGHEYTRGLFVDRRRNVEEAERVLDEFGIDLPATGVPVGLLSGGQRQAVAVARALVLGAEVVILDEPTAALGVTESARVMRLAQDLASQGKAVLLISHNLQEVWEVADRIVVLHLGQLAGIRDKSDTTVEEVVQLIVYGAVVPSSA